jgi:hypothetical protein
MTAQTAAKPCQSTTIARSMPGAYYQLHALLQTLRALASHEDDICALLTEIERTGRISATARRDLSRMLGSLPLHSLHQELDELGDALQPAA